MRRGLKVDTPDSWPGLNLAFGMGETDAVEFEYLDRTESHKAGRPDSLDDFYRTARLHLSPLPQLTGLERSSIGQSVRGWLGRRTQTNGKSSVALGIEAIFDTAFESRPKKPEKESPLLRVWFQRKQEEIFPKHIGIVPGVRGGVREVSRRAIRSNISVLYVSTGDLTAS
jgi:hypothetical protein